MENYQDKIKEIIYNKCFIVYKKCLKLTILSNDILEVNFDNKLAKKLIDKRFIDETSNDIIKQLNLSDNNCLKKIIDYHFKNIKISKIGGKYNIKKNYISKNIEDLFNPIKFEILKKFYENLELTRLENNIFNFLNFNDFIYYTSKNFIKFVQPLGYLIIMIFILYLVEN